MAYNLYDDVPPEQTDNERLGIGLHKVEVVAAKMKRSKIKSTPGVNLMVADESGAIAWLDVWVTEGTIVKMRSPQTLLAALRTENRDAPIPKGDSDQIGAAMEAEDYVLAERLMLDAFRQNCESWVGRKFYITIFLKKSAEFPDITPVHPKDLKTKKVREKWEGMIKDGTVAEMQKRLDAIRESAAQAKAARQGDGASTPAAKPVSSIEDWSDDIPDETKEPETKEPEAKEPEAKPATDDDLPF